MVLTVLLLVLTGEGADAAGIVSLQSIDIKPYNDAYDGFKSSCGCEPEQLVMSEMDRNKIIRSVRSLKPDLILAIGIRALKEVSAIKDIPVVYLMVLDPDPVIEENLNITGVNIYIPPDKQLFHIKNIIPHISNIGIIYDPVLNGDFVKKAVTAAKDLEIGLTVRDISNPKDFPDLLQDIKAEIDAFWMLPDVTAFTTETTEYLFLYSIENNIPVITFSERYLDMGALISFNIDAFDMGKQASHLGAEILKNDKINEGKKTFARKANITINQKTAKKLGIFNINNKLIKAIAINMESPNEISGSPEFQ